MRRMRRRMALPLAATIVLASCAPSATSAAPAPIRKDPPGSIHHVLLITLDGLLPDSYEHPDAHGLKVPTLRWLIANGASSDGALSVFPSVTFPSHTSMTTGVFPGAHGIVGNTMFDPREHDLDELYWYAEDIKRDPIWRVVERAGYQAALVHWPVSVGAKVTWLVPEFWRARNDNDKKLLRALSTHGLLESVAEEHADFWQRYSPPEAKDDALTDIAAHILVNAQPNLLQLHLVEVDNAQHHFGVWSPEAIGAIEDDDRQLARIFELVRTTGLSKDTSVIVASDHGFANSDKMVKPGVLLREAGLVTIDGAGRITDWKAKVVVNTGQAYVYVRDPADAVTRDAVRNAFSAKAGQQATGIGRVFTADEVHAAMQAGTPRRSSPSRLHPVTRWAPATPATTMHRPSTEQPTDTTRHAPICTHLSLLFGPNVPHGTIAKARLVDIAPTIADWLGLTMPNVDGRPLRITPAP